MTNGRFVKTTMVASIVLFSLMAASAQAADRVVLAEEFTATT